MSRTQTSDLFWRAVIAFLALPGVVAFAVPLLWLAPRGRSFHVLGFAPLLLGVCFLLWTVRDFYVAGRGTLAPWSPPEELVVVGLYRVSRNPMYIAVILVLLGWALGFESLLLGMYALLIAVGFHLRVLFGEEPWLASVHGEKWRVYKENVPRWLGVPGGAFRRRTMATKAVGADGSNGIAARITRQQVAAELRRYVANYRRTSKWLRSG